MLSIVAFLPPGMVLKNLSIRNTDLRLQNSFEFESPQWRNPPRRCDSYFRFCADQTASLCHSRYRLSLGVLRKRLIIHLLNLLFILVYLIFVKPRVNGAMRARLPNITAHALIAEHTNDCATAGAVDDLLVAQLVADLPHDPNEPAIRGLLHGFRKLIIGNRNAGVQAGFFIKQGVELTVNSYVIITMPCSRERSSAVAYRRFPDTWSPVPNRCRKSTACPKRGTIRESSHHRSSSFRPAAGHAQAALQRPCAQLNRCNMTGRTTANHKHIDVQNARVLSVRRGQILSARFVHKTSCS